MNSGYRTWGIIICLVGGFYLFEGFRLPPAAIGDPLGPLVFPTILGVSMVACGAYLAVRPGPRKPPVLTLRAGIPAPKGPITKDGSAQAWNIS